jgi:aryl-alcohol dehydrogenase-like predicted oxidoreductase
MVIPSHRVGLTNVVVPLIGIGTWIIEGNSVAASRLAIEATLIGLDLGITQIDIAEMYGNGRAEELVAESISSQCDDVFWQIKLGLIALLMKLL